MRLWLWPDWVYMMMFFAARSMDSEHVGEQSDLCLRAVTCWQPPESGCSRWHRLERAGWPVPSVCAGIAPAACPDCPLRNKQSHHVTSCNCLFVCFFLLITSKMRLWLNFWGFVCSIQNNWQRWIHNYHPSICFISFNDINSCRMDAALTEGGGFEVRCQDADFPCDEFVADFLQKLVGREHSFS